MKNNTSTTNIDWFRRKDENYYPKVFLEKCFVFEWKIPKNKIKCINLYQKKEANWLSVIWNAKNRKELLFFKL